MEIWGGDLGFSTTWGDLGVSFDLGLDLGFPLGWGLGRWWGSCLHGGSLEYSSG